MTKYKCDKKKQKQNANVAKYKKANYKYEKIQIKNKKTTHKYDKIQIDKIQT